MHYTSQVSTEHGEHPVLHKVRREIELVSTMCSDPTSALYQPGKH